MDTHRGEPEPFDGEQPPAIADDELLRQFVATRDEQAFGELVRRHSGLVLGVCRRTLRDEHDAEEVFQATFMVLAAKAARVRVAHTVGPWLYGVAYRIAIRAATKRARRREAPLPDDLKMIEDALQDVAECHWRRVLDDELNLLPDKYRSAVVLHYLLGKSNNEVAVELGLSVRTVEGRQRRGKELLKRRLMMHRVSLPAALAALAAASQPAQASASASLISGTIAASLGFVGGNSGAAAANAVSLAQMETMAMTSTVAPVSVTLITLSLIGGALALAGGHAPAQGGGSTSLLAVASAVAVEGAAEADQSVDDVSVAVATFDDASPAVDVEENSFDLVERSRMERKILKSLADKELALDFVEMPLQEVMMVISEEIGGPVWFDRPALDSEGLTPDVTVTFQLKDVPLRSALRLMLHDVKLAYVIKNGVLLITTETAASKLLEPHVYDLRDSASSVGIPIEELASMIQSTVAPESWVESGGWGTVRQLGDAALVVNQTQDVHEDIARFLRQVETHAKRLSGESPAARSR